MDLPNISLKTLFLTLTISLLLVQPMQPGYQNTDPFFSPISTPQAGCTWEIETLAGILCTLGAITAIQVIRYLSFKKHFESKKIKKERVDSALTE